MLINQVPQQLMVEQAELEQILAQLMDVSVQHVQFLVVAVVAEKEWLLEVKVLVEQAVEALVVKDHLLHVLQQEQLILAAVVAAVEKNQVVVVEPVDQES
jgi:hypothetical protein